MTKDFIVVDTEGNPLLRELAIINARGELMLHAFTDEHPENKSVRVNRLPLADILRNFGTKPRLS